MSRPPSAPTRRTRLDNGLAVVARPNRAARSIAVRLVFEAGGAFDPPGRQGTAALVSGLLDRGAGGLTARTIADGFDDLGASYLARATRDCVPIESRLLAHHLPEILGRLRLIAAEPSFPEDEVRRARDRMITAVAEREQDTAAVAEDALAAALFPDAHPYRGPDTGTRDSLGTIGRDDLVAFHRRRFGPTGAVLVLAGDIDPGRAVALAEAAFGSWPAGGPGDRRTSIPAPPPLDRATVVVRPIQGKTQADVALGFHGLSRLSPDLPAALVLNNALGEFSLGGRLGDAIRERSGMAYNAYSYFEAGLGAGPFALRAGVAPDKVGAVVRMMRRTVEGIVRRGLTAAEVRDSKRSLAASIPRRLETNPGAAAYLGDCEFYGLGTDWPERLQGLIERVDRERVEAAARTYLTLGRCALVVAGPALDEAALR